MLNGLSVCDLENALQCLGYRKLGFSNLAVNFFSIVEFIYIRTCSCEANIHHEKGEGRTSPSKIEPRHVISNNVAF